MTDYKKEREIAENALRAQEYPNIDDHALWVKNLAASGDYIAMANPARYLELLTTIQDQADTIEKLKNFVTMFDRWYSSEDGDEKGLAFPDLKKARLALNDWCADWTPHGEKE
jgi:hypothetical protein